MVRGQDYDPIKGFLRGVRENFLPSSFATILLLGDVTLLAVLRSVLYAETLLMPPGLFVLLAILAVFLTALLSYLFPLLAPFDHDMYLILDLAVGGSWVGYPDETTDFAHAAFEVDYVRVYQRDQFSTEGMTHG